MCISPIMQKKKKKKITFPNQALPLSRIFRELLGIASTIHSLLLTLLIC